MKTKINEVLKRIINKLGKAGVWTVILTLVIFISSLFASLIQNDWGNIEVETIYFEARDNQTVAYDLYTPSTATLDNKAPLMIVIAGFQRSRETQGHVALEFARRGFVVINIDPYSQGDSSSSQGIQGRAIATMEGYGAFDIIDYVYDHDDVYPYVDKDRIGVTGHSAGGNAAYQAAVYFGKRAVDNNGVSKVHSIYISGYVLSINSSINFSKSNMGMDYALYDEGAFRNPINLSAPEGYSKADMTWGVESHIFVNSGLEKQGLPLIPDDTQVEIGRIYGNPTLRNMRQVFNTPTIHAFQPYDTEATKSNIAFFEVAMDFRNSEIRPDDQVWVTKEVFTSISLIASLSMLVPVTTLLYRIPFFKKSMQELIIDERKRSKGSIINYIVVFLITATFAALTYLPSAKLSLALFPEASQSVNTWFFPQRMTNAVAVWAVLSGTFAMLVFMVSRYISLSIQKKKLNKEMNYKEEFKKWGVSLGWKNLGKTVLLGLSVVTIYFLLLMVIYWIFHVDYRFIFIMAARKLNSKVLIQILMYFPVFFIFYFSNSIRVNAGQMRGKANEKVKLLIAGLTNIAGLSIILFMQYLAFINTGTIAFTELPDGTTQWLYVNILFTLIPVMFLMPFFNRWFYKLSGNAFLGPIIICIIFVIMTLNNSVAYIPI
ncbi:MAG: acetylxylan esterase [Firmicutes bacterium]|nr:acetylxylan esterase [Bacillota bacterium]